MEYQRVTHEFPPLIDPDCRVIVLGSIPSPKSREQAFYYGHPQNRFWKVMAEVLNEPVPSDIEEKKRMMLKHHVALYDSLEECDIKGAGDSSIRNPVGADIASLIKGTRISRVFTAGAASYKYYNSLCRPSTGIEAERLPSTSPANCAVSFEKLVSEYKKVAEAADPEIAPADN